MNRDSSIRDFNLFIKVRNNQLIKRRLDLGCKTAIEFARLSGIGYGLYAAYEALTESPLSEKGGWKPMALHIAAYHNVSPDELWPDVILNVDKNKVKIIKEFDADDVASLLSEHCTLATLPPSELYERKELYDTFEGILNTLEDKERLVLEKYYVEGLARKEVESELGISKKEMVKIELSALRKLRSHESDIHQYWDGTESTYIDI